MTTTTGTQSTGTQSTGTQSTGTQSSGSQSEGTTATDGRLLRRQGQATRNRLLDAAVGVLAEKGYHSSRVDDVVGDASVSHGTFYLYFANKEDLFRALAERCADEVAELATDLGPIGPDADGRAELRAWLARYLEMYRSSGPVIRAWNEGQVADRKLARLGRASFSRVRDALEQVMPSGNELRATALLAMVERFSYSLSTRPLAVADDVALDTLALIAHRSFFGGS